MPVKVDDLWGRASRLATALASMAHTPVKGLRQHQLVLPLHCSFLLRCSSSFNMRCHATLAQDKQLCNAMLATHAHSDAITCLARLLHVLAEVLKRAEVHA